MEKTNKLLEELNKPLSKQQLENIIYNLFCIIIFLMPVIPEKIGMGIYSLKNTIFNMVTIMTAISLAVVNIKDLKFKLNVYYILVIIYLILVGLSTVFSKHGITECILGTNGRGEGLLTIFSYLVTFVICTKGYPYIKKTFKVGLIAATIVSIYGIIQANVPIDVELPFGVANELGVAEGTMGNQNFFSSYLCIFLPMLCYYFLNTKHYTSIILVGLLFTAFTFAKTLGGYLVFIVMYVAICIFSVIYSKQKKVVLVKILIMTLMIVSIFMLITYEKDKAYVEELSETKQEVVNLVEKDEDFATNRLRIWKRVVMAIDNNKLVGIGPDSLSSEFKDKQYHIEGNKDMLSKRNVDKAHSEYLQIAVTTGVPSLIVYILLLLIICLRLAKIIFKVNKHNVNNENKLFITMTGIAIVSYLAQAVGNISVVQVAPIFWVILGLGAGITLHEK
ncbi:MAG: O-antigen ligase family protein [Clostridia bacterium]|nr:O-antigen ligase family protein [Clostridia bacterium]